jgi:hypothetical protein
VKPVPLDPTVRALGVVSLLNDFSSEVAVRTLPLFLANVLGVRIGIIGLIEGIAESTATLLRLVSGYLADRTGRKKSLALWGYGFSNLTKPLLFFATSWGLVLAVRFLDRVGKGIRSAPRDALMADITPPELRGREFGFMILPANTDRPRRRRRFSERSDPVQEHQTKLWRCFREFQHLNNLRIPLFPTEYFNIGSDCGDIACH